MEPPPEHPDEPTPPPLGHLPKTGDGSAGSYLIFHILLLGASLAVPVVLLLSSRHKKSADEAIDAIYDDDDDEER